MQTRLGANATEVYVDLRQLAGVGSLSKGKDDTRGARARSITEGQKRVLVISFGVLSTMD